METDNFENIILRNTSINKLKTISLIIINIKIMVF